MKTLLDHMQKVFKQLQTVEQIRGLPKYQVMLYLRSKLLEQGLKSELATTIVSTTQIEVSEDTIQDPAFWKMLDMFVSTIATMYKAVCSDFGDLEGENALKNLACDFKIKMT